MTSKHRMTGLSRTGGFTLVELLVVFVIIAILSALTIGVVFKVIGVQQRGNTELTVKTVSSLLDKHWASVIKAHQNDVIPNNVLAIAGNDPRRARVIWIKLNLKREFPMNLTEAISPWSVGLAGAPLIASDLPAKQNYIAAINQAKAMQLPPLTPSSFGPSNDPTIWPLESSFTLVTALQQNRSGIAFAEENFGAGALATEIFVWQSGPPIQRNPTPFLQGPKMLVDAWSTPLAFYRWPLANSDFFAGSTGSVLTGNVGNSSFPDPLDPEGTLIDPRWNNKDNWTNQLGVWWFEKYCHTVHTWVPSRTPPYMPYACYTEPVVVSPGPDHALGVTPVGTVLTLGASPTSPAPSLPDEMNVPATPSNDWLDNIASYKLRLGGTGDK